MNISITNNGAEINPQIEENEAVSESKEKPKRHPETWEAGWTEIENRIFTQGRFLSSDAKVIYSTLKSFQNGTTGLCFPAYPAIMERSGMTRPRVADALRELKRFNWLSAKERFGGSSYYKFHTPFVYQLDENKNRISFHDQTCPTKAQAKEWSKGLRTRRGKGKSWSDTVKAESKKAEKREAEWELCNCGLDDCEECEIPF